MARITMGSNSGGTSATWEGGGMSQASAAWRVAISESFFSGRVPVSSS